MKVGDYVVCFINDKKQTSLAKIESMKNGIHVRLEPDANGELFSLDIKKSDILCNVGSKPNEGSVFGISTSNIFRCRKPIGKFGHLSYFRAPDKEIRSTIFHSFNLVAKRLEKLGLDWIFEESIIFECRKLRSTALGMYQPKRKVNNYSFISISENNMADGFPLTIAHELGHHVFTKLDDYWETKWIVAYSQIVNPINADSSALKELKSNLDNCDSIKDFLAIDDEEQKQLAKDCLKFIKKCFKVSNTELQKLFESDKERVIRAFPKSVSSCNYELLISEYAKKNYKEMFAEAFSMYVMGKELPKEIRILVKKTIGFVKVNRDTKI